MHPQNFPSIRIAQFSSMLDKIDFIINHLNDLNSYDKWVNSLKGRLSFYWKTHYDFGKKTNKRNNDLGELSINSIIINAIIPFLFFYSERTKNQVLFHTAQELIKSMVPESNSTIKLYSSVLPKPVSAVQTQAMIELEKEYCSKSGCLNCLVGKTILQRA